MRIALALLLAALAAAPAAAQTPATSPQPVAASSEAPTSTPLARPAVAYKEKGTATLVGVLITGGGHFYTGETGKGLTLLGLGIGAPLAGYAATLSTCDYVADGVCYGGNPTPALVGLGVGLGAWIYGIADAGKSAERANARNGYAPVALAPTVLPSQVGAQPGLALSARF